ELARRRHTVLHLHFAEFQTPKGRLRLAADDPATLDIAAVSIGRPFAKYSFVRRRFQEAEIGTRLAARIESFNPDAVVGCNLPLVGWSTSMCWIGSKKSASPPTFGQIGKSANPSSTIPSGLRWGSMRGICGDPGPCSLAM